MAELQINISQIKENILKLSAFFKTHSKQWSLITKVFSGDKEFLRLLLEPEIYENIHSIGDSRISSLKNLKEVNPSIKTIYIKPPAYAYVEDVVRYADVSCNSSIQTIEALDIEAKKLGKVHQIIIMIELGELREGILREEIMNFYEKVFELENIEVIGLGSNLGCMYGIEPTFDKLLQLCLYKEIIELKFKTKLELISGGSSITLPLVEHGNVPEDMNHFRIGEAAFFGTSPLNESRFLDLNTDNFMFKTHILELEHKDMIPDGKISDANIGHTFEPADESILSTNKAILDFGLLDVDQENLFSNDPNISFVGITSDMTVVNIGDNEDATGNPIYTVGDTLTLRPNYLAVARLLNSKFIDKEFIV